MEKIVDPHCRRYQPLVTGSFPVAPFTVTGQTGDSDSLRGSPACDVTGGEDYRAITQTS